MQEQKIAVFPGSFDPLTNGHCDIIARALPLFDKIIIAIGRNSEKNCMFSLEERMDFVRRTYADQPKIEVTNYEGMTVDFCRSIGVKFMLRGLCNLGLRVRESHRPDQPATLPGHRDGIPAHLFGVFVHQFVHRAGDPHLQRRCEQGSSGGGKRVLAEKET